MVTERRQIAYSGFDRVNLDLLGHLLDEPRLSIAELARRVGMSAPAVGERLQRDRHRVRASRDGGGAGRRDRGA